MEEKESILVVCAHSDDHILGAGGTIAKYVSEGKHVHVVVLSYGEKTHPWLKADIAKNMRAQETRYADSVVGCNSTFFDLKEGNFMDGFEETKKKLVEIVEKERPAKVFTHTNEDPHPDHRASLEIVLDVLRAVKMDPEVYLFSIWNPFSLKKSHLPQMYVDTTETYSRKIDALKHFRSQRAALVLLLWGIFVRDFKNGLHIHGKFAERFYRLQ
jgi:LmbE family N-acetylglucosaminyl deacetylase